MKSALVTVVFLACIYCALAIDYNYQTLKGSLSSTDACYTAYNMTPITQSGYVSISATYTQYGPEKLYTVMSWSSTFDSTLAYSHSVVPYNNDPTSVFSQTDILQAKVVPVDDTPSTLYIMVCRTRESGSRRLVVNDRVEARSISQSNDTTPAPTPTSTPIVLNPVDWGITFEFRCEESSYPVDNLFTCSPCPGGSARPLIEDFSIGSPEFRSVETCKCLSGHYRINTGSSFTCAACPDGATCIGGNDVPTPEDGYYPLVFNSSTLFVKCPFDRACLHSTNGKNITSSSGIPYMNLCTDGYSGYLCGTCSANHYRLNTRCLECGNNADANRFYIALYAIGLFIVFILSIPITMMNTHVSSFSILLNFVQTSALFTIFNLKWTDALLGFFDFLSVYNLNVQLVRPECTTSAFSYYPHFMVTIFLPIIYFLVSLLILLGAFALWAILRKKLGNSWFKKFLQWTVSSWFSTLLLQGYVILASWTLAFYSCEDYSTFYHYYDQARKHLWYTIQSCDYRNEEFNKFAGFFWTAFAFYVIGIPIVTLTVFYIIVWVTRWKNARLVKATQEEHAQQRRNLLDTPVNSTEEIQSPQSPQEEELRSVPQTTQEKISSKAEEIHTSLNTLIVEGRHKVKMTPGIEAKESMIRTFGCLYHRYRPRRFFWESLVILRKLCLAIIFAYLQQKPVIAVVVASVIILISLVLHLYFQPYRKHTSNLLETLLLLLQYGLLILTLMFYASNDVLIALGYNTIVDVIVFIAMFVGIVAGLIVLVLELLYEFRRFWYLPRKERKRLAMQSTLEPAEPASEHFDDEDSDDEQPVAVQFSPVPVSSPSTELQDVSVAESSEPVVTALFDYEPQNHDELAIKKGDKLVVVEKRDDDWWKVKKQGTDEEGLVPGNYME
jgi:hypothetical protein